MSIDLTALSAKMGGIKADVETFTKQLGIDVATCMVDGQFSLETWARQVVPHASVDQLQCIVEADIDTGVTMIIKTELESRAE